MNYLNRGTPWNGVKEKTPELELIWAVEWLFGSGWKSVEKDNMEYECRTTYFVLDRLNEAKEALEAKIQR